MPSKLEQLKAMTTVVADTGDLAAVKKFEPTDCTTNPSLVLKAAQDKAGAEIIAEGIEWGRSHGAEPSKICDRLAVSFGIELTKIVPGRVSTEVDADLSFDKDALLAKAHAIIEDYESRGVGRDRVLIKLASTWEGIQAAKVLQGEGIDCNLTLLFSMAQAAACADAGAFLISPFVGRIMDYYAKAEGKTYTGETDPGVKSVREIYAYYKTHGIKTVVMGASFRNLGEIEALAGCDRLTIAPKLLEELAQDDGDLPRKLDAKGPFKDVPARMTLDEKTFRLMLNDDAMATDKLADGIRLFTKDLRTLQAMVSKELESNAEAPLTAKAEKASPAPVA